VGVFDTAYEVAFDLVFEVDVIPNEVPGFFFLIPRARDGHGTQRAI